MKIKIPLIRKHRIPIIYLSILMLFGILPKLQSQNVANESFSYAPGTFLVSSSWTGTTAATPYITAVSGNLSYPNTIGSTTGNKVLLGPTGQTVRKYLDSQQTVSVSSPSIYASAVVNVINASSTGDYFYSLGQGTTNTQNAFVYIRANGSGFSFGVVKNTGTIVYEDVVRDYNTNYFIVLKYEHIPGNSNDIVSLYINTTSVIEPTTPDIQTSTSTDVSNFISVYIAQRGNTLELDGVNVGRSWNSVVGPVFDHGDVPVSYDTSINGIYMPAIHKPVSGFYFGQIEPISELLAKHVNPGEDNNGSNGDGVEEDAVDGSSIEIRKGLPFSLRIPINNPAAIPTKILDAWIDFNNNGKFEASEYVMTYTGIAGRATPTLTWTINQTGTIPEGVTKLYGRIRLSDKSFNDLTSGTNSEVMDERSIGNGAYSASNSADASSVATGEVEDFQINVVDTFEYGDLPTSFDTDINGNFLPARHAPLQDFRIGNLFDLESAPASVTSPNQNNTSGDNSIGLADEDGLTSLPTVLKGVPFSITVPTRYSSGTKAVYLYGWLDLNGDGRFQANEMQVYNYYASSGGTNAILTWPAATTNLITQGTKKIYLRLRLSEEILTDFTSGTNSGLIDERSIGNGATSASNSANNLRSFTGEVEDYQLDVDIYEYGDVPVSYELNNAGVSVPARHLGNPSNRMGRLLDVEYIPANVEAGEDNNGSNGDGEDEDGLVSIPVVRKGVSLSFSVPVTLAVAHNIIAWVDFNNNGRFEASEVCYTAATGTGTGYRSIAVGTNLVKFWFRGTQTATIPEGVTNLYARIRLSQTTGSDNTNTALVDERSIGDGASGGVYGVPINGEVEDYRFPIAASSFDFGDVPQSYEMDRNGTDVVNFKPARNYPTSLLFLGDKFDNETAPQSVSSGADNNGTNGDGEDEDGISSDQLILKAATAKSFTVVVNNSTEAAASLYGWIDFNNNGRFESGEASTVVSVPIDATTATVSFTAAQVSSAIGSKLYMRLRYLQAEAGVTIADLASGTNSALLDERSIADGLSTGDYGAISQGEVEDYQLTILRDYGDVPLSYENGDPGSQTNTLPAELYIGNTIDYETAAQSVEVGDDNNGLNGDGEDEDGIQPGQVVTNGTAFTLNVPVNTTLTGTKYLYGWIDFNGDGIFNGNEGATVSGTVTAGTTSNLILTWSTVNLSTSVLIADKVYARLRLSTTALTNSNGAALIDTRSFRQSNATGEIEDYQFDVTNNFDHGDLPASFETGPAGSLPARSAVSPLLRLGDLVEIDDFPNSVAPGADNNGANGDGLEEDGVKRMISLYKNNTYYVRIKVLNNTGAEALFVGWLDFNNDGRFQIAENSFAWVKPSASPQDITLGFSTNTIAANRENIYMRLRLATTMSESSGVYDGRAIGDGTYYTSSYNYGIPKIGEIEDYRVSITTNLFDYGDLPDSYDLSRNDIVAPARQAASVGLFIGDEPADEELTKQTSADADGDSGGIVDDEVNFITNPVFSNRPYTIDVPVTNYTGSRTLYGWIDFNENGRFEATEVATLTVNNRGKSTYKLTWTAAQTNVIVGVPSRLALRLRIAEGTLTDFTTGVPGALVDERSIADGLNTGEYAASPTVLNGEIEDHFVGFTYNSDFGDVPESYEMNNSGVVVQARGFANKDLLIGSIVDIEPSAQSVAAGADNNGTNGDGLDEDGIIGSVPDFISGSTYGISVNVVNHSGSSATLRGWIDMDGNGRFTANEHVSVAVPSLAYPAAPDNPDFPEQPAPGPIPQTIRLEWPFFQYTGSSERTYMRLRLTNGTLSDNSSTANVDERSLGDGLSSGIHGVSSGSTLYPLDGEVEDYVVNIVRTDIELEDCDPNDDTIVMSPMQSLFHGNIVKSGNDWLVFGNGANGNGSNQNTPVKVLSGSNGFNFQGVPLMVTGASNSSSGLPHQYVLLSSAGLYVFGANSFIFSKSSGMQQVPMPPSIPPGSVQMIDAGSSTIGLYSLALLTKTGEVWVYSNTAASAVQGDGGLAGLRWHQVMVDATTPLTGMTDIKSAGASIIAMDGERVYTWGRNVYLGNESNVTTRNYATQMTLPANITRPILQQDLSNSAGTSYYLRDSAGLVFVLGANTFGQLGIGSTTNISSWLSIDEVNEEPPGAGNETDITKELPEVAWISANNHDSSYPIFSLITAGERRVYTTGSNDGSKSGVVGATAIVSSNIIKPTAITVNNGAQMLEGRITFIETGGHVSILVREGSDRYGYTGHTAEGSDGCGGCTQSPKEFNFNGPPSTGVVCGNTPAYDYGDLDERYNLGGSENMARHEIISSQEDTPLKLGTVGPDSEYGAQYTDSGSTNTASGDDTDALGDDEDAFTGLLPEKLANNSYVLEVPLTNKTDSTAYLYGFIDWNGNGVFDARETVVAEVPASETAQTVTLTWEHDPLNCNDNLQSLRSFVRLRLTTQLISDDPDTPQDERSFLSAMDGEVEDYFLDWIQGACDLLCYKPPITTGGTILDTSVGVSSITRDMTNVDNWPTVRKGAWLAMESRTKGFVLNRVAFNNLNQPIGILPSNFVEGMAIYDTTNKCIKVYTSQDNGVSFGWYCMSNQACPD